MWVGRGGEATRPRAMASKTSILFFLDQSDKEGERGGEEEGRGGEEEGWREGVGGGGLERRGVEKPATAPAWPSFHDLLD